MQQFVKIALVENTPTDVKDEYGDKIVIESLRSVWAQVKSISQREFYQAQTAGLKPTLKFVLKTSRDYHEERFLVYNNLRYEIQRTYINESDEIELTVYGGVRDERTKDSN